MSSHAIMEKLSKDQMKDDIPQFSVGDTIKVHQRIIEGEKERIQIFQGLVIGFNGKNVSETFKVYRVSCGEGMTRTFFLHSPRIAKIELLKRGRVRRAKLYYLIGKMGKSIRLKEKR